MSGTLRALMGGLVDYAGLFPPASLDLVTAVAEYAAHRGEPEAWMLGRLVLPAARLEEAAAVIAAVRPDDAVWPCVALVGAADGVEAARAAVPVQGAAVAAFERAAGGRTPVEALETPIPAAAARENPAAFIDRLTTDLVGAGLDGRELYWETPAGGDDAAVIAAVAEHAASGAPFARSGVKLRCGGVTAAAFPPPDRVAEVVALCRDHAVPLKATAGLHHPVRHRADAPDVTMHGFLNVFGAGLLAWGLDAPRPDLLACVAETDPAAFTFTDQAFGWRDRRVPAAKLAEVRRRWLCGFGSCSFAEPRQDLRDLGLL